jgi:tRNA pseudouridine38-40 synthase
VNFGKENCFILTISYDGTEFFGWHCPKNRSIRTTLEAALNPFFGPVTLLVASRTDRGVHAVDQKVVLKNSQNKSLSAEEVDGIRRLLPLDLILLDIRPCPSDFHPSLSAKSKEYRYYFHSTNLPPHFNPYSLKIDPIDSSSIEKGLHLFLGTHDFNLFEDRSNTLRGDKTCTLFSLEFISLSQGVTFLKIVGDRFLYHMCRKIAGTLLYVGYGKISINQLEKGIGNLTPRDIGPTLPPSGLILQKVTYDRIDSLSL